MVNIMASQRSCATRGKVNQRVSLVTNLRNVIFYLISASLADDLFLYDGRLYLRNLFQYISGYFCALA
jgi:hypothetical protein